MALPLKKRFHGKMPLAKRIKRLETVQSRRKPELKVRTMNLSGSLVAGGTDFAIIEVTDISQGDNIDERIGDEIRLHRVQARGDVANMDLYLIQSMSTSAPTVANFAAVAGGHLTSANQKKFTEWWHFYQNSQPSSASNPDMNMSFRFPPKVTYAGATGTSGQRNKYYFCIKTTSMIVQSYEISIKVWYTDN